MLFFFETHEDPHCGWILNNYPNKMLRGTEVEVNDKKYNITPGTQKVLVDSKYKIAKSLNDTGKLAFRDILQKTNSNNGIPKGRMSGRDKYFKIDLDIAVRRILNLDTNLIGKGIKINIPSNIID